MDNHGGINKEYDEPYYIKAVKLAYETVIF